MKYICKESEMFKWWHSTYYIDGQKAWIYDQGSSEHQETRSTTQD